jgi:hypothetical protein
MSKVLKIGVHPIGWTLNPKPQNRKTKWSVAAGHLQEEEGREWDYVATSHGRKHPTQSSMGRLPQQVF